MSTNLKIAYPDIPFNAVSVISSETYDTDYPVRNLISGSRGNIARLASELIGQNEIEFDLGSGISQACDYVALVNAKRLKASGVDYVRLRGSDASYQYPTSMLGIYDPERDVTYNSSMQISQVSDQSGNSNHATQSTDANKPLLSRADNKENYLLSSGDWGSASFVNDSTTAASNTVVNSQGTTTATTVTASAASARHSRYQSMTGTARPTGTAVKLSVEVKKGNYRYLWIGDRSHSSWHGVCLDLDTGTLGTQASLTSASIETLSSGWYRVSIGYNVSDTSSCSVAVYFNTSNATSSPQSFLAAGTETFYVDRGSWSESGADSDYIANTTFAQPRGINGNRVMVFDGSNDHLFADGLISAANGTDKALTAIIVAKSNLAPAANRTFFDFYNSGASNPHLEFYEASVNRYATWKRDDAGTNVTVVPSGGGNTVDTSTAVLTYIHSGTTVTLYKNGTAIFSAQSQDVGATTINKLIIGAFKGVIEPYGGKIAFLAVASSALGTTDREAWEDYLTNRFTVSPIADIDLQNVDLTGGQSKDYIETFTESAAFRYWIAQFITNTASSKRELSKLYFGKLFDMGRDPQLGMTGFSNYHQDKGIHHYKNLSMSYKGITTTKRQEFEDKIGQYKDTNEVLLHTTSYDAPLLNTDLLSVQVKNAVFQMHGASQNDLNIDVEESY